MKEIFKDIPGFEARYQITNNGRLWSKVSNKFIKPKLTNGYYKYQLYISNQKSKTFFAHRLVALCFLKNRKNKETVNHKNGIKTDNRVCNLEWNTRSENVKHGYEKGLCKKIKENRYKILDNTDVLKIRELYKNREYIQKDLAAMFNVSKSLIGAIVRNEIWKHL